MKRIIVQKHLYDHLNNLKQVDLEKQMVIEDETLEDVTIDELRDSLCEHEPRSRNSLFTYNCFKNSDSNCFSFFQLAGLWPILSVTHMEMVTSLTPLLFSFHLLLAAR